MPNGIAGFHKPSWRLCLLDLIFVQTNAMPMTASAEKTEAITMTTMCRAAMKNPAKNVKLVRTSRRGVM
jgi:hypothetical protein